MCVCVCVCVCVLQRNKTNRRLIYHKESAYTLTEVEKSHDLWSGAPGKPMVLFPRLENQGSQWYKSQSEV